jgi:hypothetical protein
MDRIQFLKNILGDDGYYCAVGIKDDKIVTQKFYRSIEEVLSTADDLCGNGVNAYFALATFETGENRKQHNVAQMRSLFLDIDYGPHHSGAVGYQTAGEVLTELQRFCKEVGMPKPNVVSSGGGIHAYWPLEEPIDKETWFPIASRLKELCIDNRLFIDTAVPADAARILRVPGTKNFRAEEAREVKVIYAGARSGSAESYRELLGEPTVLKRPSFARGEMDDVTKSILGNYVSYFKTIIEKTKRGTGCEQIRYIYEQQETLREPLWRAGLSITKYCEDVSKASYLISRRHPGYTPEITQKKLDEIKGPYHCTTIRELMADDDRAHICKECPHWGKFKSPIALGRQVAEASEEELVVQAKPEGSTADETYTYIKPKLPDPYFFGKHEGVFKRIERDGETLDICVYHNDIYVARRLNDKEQGDCIAIRLHLPKDGVREFTIPMSVVSANDEFRKQLYSRGVVIQKVDDIKNYILDSVKNMQFNEVAQTAHRQFGWTNDKCEAFILGDKEVHGKQIEYNPPTNVTGHLFPAFEKKGSLEEWKKAMEFYNRPGMELHQFIIGLSFGSIFTKFTAVNAALLHVYSPDSGLGKTTALQAAAGIWGDPAKLVLKESDTINSKMNRAEIMNNLIMLYDELTNASPMDLSNLVYQLTSGAQKNRLAPSANQERVRGEIWKLMAISTGNTSVVEKMMAFKGVPKGELMRVLEVRALKVPGLTKEATDQLSLQLVNNYGHAGIPFLQYVIEHLDEVREKHKQVQKTMDTRLGLSYQERFYSVMVANALTGLLISNGLGLTNFDVKKIRIWLETVMISALDRSNSLQLDPELILNNFWAENWNNTLRIKSSQDLRVNSATEDNDQFVVADATPRGALVLRYEFDVKKLFILTAPLRDWCVKRQVSYEGLIDELKLGRTKARMVKKRMGKGTRSNLPPVNAVCIDCREWLDEQTEKALAELGAYQADHNGDTESGRGSTVH